MSALWTVWYSAEMAGGTGGRCWGRQSLGSLPHWGCPVCQHHPLQQTPPAPRAAGSRGPQGSRLCWQVWSLWWCSPQPGSGHHGRERQVIVPLTKTAFMATRQGRQTTSTKAYIRQLDAFVYCSWLTWTSESEASNPSSRDDLMLLAGRRVG